MLEKILPTEFVVGHYNFFFFCTENWLYSDQLKDIWRIKGIVDEPETYEPSYVELSDEEQEPIKQTLSSHSDSEKEDENDDDDDDESCDSDNSEVCGTIASNKFSALEVSD